MKRFQDLDLQNLHWIQAGGWANRHELRDDDDEVVATITKPQWWKQAYTVDAPGNRWHFERKGFFKRQILIHAFGTGDHVATFDYEGWQNGGTITLPDGRTYLWKRIAFWNEKWAWLEATAAGDEDDPVLSFDTGGFFRARAALSFDQDSDFPALLVFLGWVLHTLMREDAAAAG